MVSELLPGTEVLARGLRWEVVHTEPMGEQTRVRLRGVDGALRGEEMDLPSPFEDISPVTHELRPDRPAPLANWRIYHQAFLLEQALGPLAMLAVQPGRLRVEPYQLVPVLRAIRMSRPRLLLADGVGLGKTIQAGLVLTELIARRIAHRILVVTPAGPLFDQWRTEMLERFGLNLDAIDRARLEEVRRQIELGANPFDHIPHGIASIDFLKQEHVLGLLRKSSYDVVIVDEVHHCMELGQAGSREDSQRRKLALTLARQSDVLLGLTATPHDGNDRSFASLCELLDPSLVNGRGALRGDTYRQHVVRRLKRHIKKPDGSPFFRERHVTPVPVEVSADQHGRFQEMHRALLDLVAPELRRAFQARRYDDVLSFIALLKRSVSTVAACLNTLRVVASSYSDVVEQKAEADADRRQRRRSIRDYHRKLGRFGTTSEEEDDERHRLEVEDLARQLAALDREVRRGSRELKRRSRVVEALEEIIQLAEGALPEDPKLQELAARITEIRRQEPRANVLVYTEYTDTQDAVEAALREAGIERVLTMRGGTQPGEGKKRKDVTDRFRSEDDLVLVSTDAAAEGLNLHARCHHLIHVELPFNPNRLEQRNGRIDRYGQDQDPQVSYLYLRDTFEERILLRLIAKYERQRRLLTFVPNTLGVTASSEATGERLLKGLMDEDRKLFGGAEKGLLFDFGQPEEADADPAVRELLEEIEKPFKSFLGATRIHTWLGDSGLSAESSLVQEAEEAAQRGKDTSAVGLVEFVRDAVLMEGGEVIGDPAGDETFAFRLPSTWLRGEVELPGYDPESRLLRLTTRIEVTQDRDKNAVGFLGRAHPVLRRALDRVRHLSYGAGSDQGEDARVSAASADLPSPALLFTFLGRVHSAAGSELERVLAVLVDESGAMEFLPEAAGWLDRAASERAIGTRGLWQAHFASWAENAREKAQQAVARGFEPMAAGFRADHARGLGSERDALERWLTERSREITPTGEEPARDRTGLLFGQDQPAAPAPPDWAREQDPLARLTAFASDRQQPMRLRREAQAVLSIHAKRSDLLRRRLDLAVPEMTSLGILMLVPSASAEARA